MASVRGPGFIRNLGLGLTIAAALCASAVSAQTLTPGDFTRTVTAAGLERSYLVHVPASYTGTQAVPLLVDIHGWTATAAIQKSLSKSDLLSDEKGFIVAYPQGIDNQFNAGICCGNEGIDDVAFMRALVAKMKIEAAIDARRVYATGLSNGGGMTHRLACEAANVFAAFAPIAFPISINPTSACQPSRDVPILTFMGLTDVLIPYNGGAFPSAATTIAHWRDRNACGTDPYEIHTVTGLSYCEIDTSCGTGVHTGLCSITADAFGGQFFDGHILYINPDVDVTRVAWDFMEQFLLPEVAPPAVPGLPAWLLVSLAGILAATGARLRR
jgi:polyhydroxybutyrate depolymerase